MNIASLKTLQAFTDLLLIAKLLILIVINYISN